LSQELGFKPISKSDTQGENHVKNLLNLVQ